METSAASVILIVCTKRTGNKHPGTQERAIFVETECLSFIGSAQPLESQEYKKMLSDLEPEHSQLHSAGFL